MSDAAELSKTLLDKAVTAASIKMRKAQTECVRRLAQELYDHRNGYAEPQGTIIEGVWTPDPSQYFPRTNNSLASDLAQFDRLPCMRLPF